MSGRVVATAGRRVIVRDAAGERACFLSGQRVVVGDRVDWVEAKGEGGKVVAVEPRATALVRTDDRGREQVLAANLAGLLVVTAPVDPPFRAGLVDRYLVAAAVGGLDAVVVLNKVDLGVPADVDLELALRAVVVLRASVRTGEGLDALRAAIAASDGPWALVGHSGVGKTSLAAALMPGVDVGAIGELSEYWGAGRHTTTGSRLFALPGGGEIVDSPGIRTFAPGQLAAEDVRGHFPGFRDVACRYRDCLHREGEEGCAAEADVDPRVLASYRRLLAEILEIERRTRPGARRR